MSSADAGGVGFQAAIAGDMIARNDRRESVPDVDRVPEPAERPDPHAQWDETRGVWVVWNEQTEEWDDLEAEQHED